MKITQFTVTGAPATVLKVKQAVRRAAEPGRDGKVLLTPQGR